MRKYFMSLQSLIDSSRANAGKGKWKLTPYSKEYALVEYFIDGKWIGQGSVYMGLIKRNVLGG